MISAEFREASTCILAWFDTMNAVDVVCGFSGLCGWLNRAKVDARQVSKETMHNAAIVILIFLL